MKHLTRLLLIGMRSAALFSVCGSGRLRAAGRRILPHRATYVLSLAHKGATSSTSGASWTFELEDACDGWTSTQSPPQILLLTTEGR